jgi:hypothetical protein
VRCALSLHQLCVRPQQRSDHHPDSRLLCRRRGTLPSYTLLAPHTHTHTHHACHMGSTCSSLCTNRKARLAHPPRPAPRPRAPPRARQAPRPRSPPRTLPPLRRSTLPRAGGSLRLKPPVWLWASSPVPSVLLPSLQVCAPPQVSAVNWLDGSATDLECLHSPQLSSVLPTWP